MKTCPYCGVSTMSERRVQCGAPECLRQHNNKRAREYQREARARLAAGEVAENFYSRHMASAGRRRKSNSTCVDCGAPVRHGRTTETRCRRCGQRRNAARSAALRAEAARVARQQLLDEWCARPARALRDLAAAAAGTAGRAPFASGRCCGCGEWFCCKVFNGLPRFCSKRCAVRDQRDRRRALTKGCTVTPGRRFMVFERDGWVCRICGDPVNRAAQVPDLDAPVVDHRLPLAQGGEHGPDNWQTAHFYCNSVKSDQMDFDFAEVAA